MNYDLYLPRVSNQPSFTFKKPPTKTLDDRFPYISFTLCLQRVFSLGFLAAPSQKGVRVRKSLHVATRGQCPTSNNQTRLSEPEEHGPDVLGSMTF